MLLDLVALSRMLTLHDRPVLAMVNISALELYQLLQYSWFMKYLPPQLASAGVIAVFSVVRLVGANTS